MGPTQLVAAFIALIILVVMILFVSSNYPGFVDEVKELFEDVFGFTQKKMLGFTAEQNKDVSLSIFDKIKESYNNCKGEGCVCDFNAYDMPAGYEIVLDGKKITLYDGHKKILKRDNLVVDMCVMDSVDKTVNVSEIIIHYDGGLLVNVLEKEYKLKENYPKLYRKDGKTCFILENQEDFVNIKSCEKNESYSVEEMNRSFNEFLFKFEDCLDSVGKAVAYCRCSELDFRGKLYPSYSIVANSDDEGVMFFLMFKEQVLESKSYNFDSGDIIIRGNSIWEDFKWWITTWFGIKPEKYVDFFDFKKLNDFEGYLVGVKRNLNDGKFYEGVFFSEKLPDLPACSGWGDVYDANCKGKLEFEKVYSVMEDNEYIQFIQENVNDEEQQLLIMAIAATESKGDKNAISLTGCAGLMQFAYCTAWAYSSLPDSPSCSGAGYRKTGSEIFTKLKSGQKNGDPPKLPDDRFDPKKSINAADLLLKQKVNYFEKKGYDNAEIFGIVSYNVGEGNIMKAIEKGKLGKDAVWSDVKKNLKSVIGSAKSKETGCYPYYVNNYYNYFRSKFGGEHKDFGGKVGGKDLEFSSCEDYNNNLECYEHLEDGCIPFYTTGYIFCLQCGIDKIQFEVNECEDIKNDERLCEKKLICGKTFDCEFVEGDKFVDGKCVDKGDCSALDESSGESGCYNKDNLIRCLPLTIVAKEWGCYSCDSRYSSLINSCGAISDEKLCNAGSFCGKDLNCYWKDGECITCSDVTCSDFDEEQITCSDFDEEQCYKNLGLCTPSFKIENILPLGNLKHITFDSCKPYDPLLLNCNLFSHYFCETFGKDKIKDNQLNCIWDENYNYNGFKGICKDVREEEEEVFECLNLDFENCKSNLNKCIPIPSYISGIPCVDCSLYEDINCNYLLEEDLCSSNTLCGKDLDCEWLNDLCVDRVDFCSLIDSEEQCYENLDRCIPEFVSKSAVPFSEDLYKVFDSCNSCSGNENLVDCSLFSENFCRNYGQQEICDEALNCVWERVYSDEKGISYSCVKRY